MADLNWYTKEGSSYPGKIDPAFINAINYAGGLAHSAGVPADIINQFPAIVLQEGLHTGGIGTRKDLGLNIKHYPTRESTSKLIESFGYPEAKFQKGGKKWSTLDTEALSTITSIMPPELKGKSFEYAKENLLQKAKAYQEYKDKLAKYEDYEKRKKEGSLSMQEKLSGLVSTPKKPEEPSMSSYTKRLVDNHPELIPYIKEVTPERLKQDMYASNAAEAMFHYVHTAKAQGYDPKMSATRWYGQGPIARSNMKSLKKTKQQLNKDPRNVEVKDALYKFEDHFQD